jgi:hypothetical protein
MTLESSLFVRMPEALDAPIADLERRAAAAYRRSKKLPPGDRSEAVRFERIHAAIDQIAISALLAGAPHARGHAAGSDASETVNTTILRRAGDCSPGAPREIEAWLAAGRPVVELRLPHTPGDAGLRGEPGRGPPPVARRWVSTASAPREAMRERFDFLLAEALDADAFEGVIRPSGITNSVLTEALRREAGQQPDKPAIELPVRYVDGSSGPLFPLRTLPLVDCEPEGWRLLAFTLLSIRHVEMDEIVHGAWFRNAQISAHRPQGLTDEVAYQTSRRQLMLLDPKRPTLIHLYQTGFEPAVMGFYRALLHHLIDYPHSVAVTPHYFRSAGSFSKGTPWTRG